tara:strand:- start:301 stop:924 length:624 start_codon:yes stop_codon:yes gene_type:complete
MKRSVKIFLMSLLSVVSLNHGLSAQNADAVVSKLANKYGSVPNYKLNIVYEANNEDMGFQNVQEGTLVVKGNQYILKYGPNETWLNDGEVEYVGTKEEDHSQILYFCPGQNSEAIVDYGNLLTFYSYGHTASMDGNMIKLVPTSEKSYTELRLTVDGDNLTKISAIDKMGTVYSYSLSGFSTSVGDPKFVINKREYAETIDERKGCK